MGFIMPLQDDGYSVEWYAKIIRAIFQPSTERESCAVCDKYKSITEAHHVIPVAEMATLCHKAKVLAYRLEKLPVYFMWLCPNHHALFHLLSGMKGKSKSQAEHLAIIHDIGIEEHKAMKTVFDWYSKGHSEFRKFLLGQGE